MDQIIDAILKNQFSVFRKIAAAELSIHNDIEHSKEERKPAYTITKTKSRFIKIFNAIEVD